MALHTLRLGNAFAAFTLLAGVSVLPPLALAQTPAPTTTTTHNHQERHPELRAALRALENARRDLQKGAHDYDGKREAALRDTDRAIENVKQALAERH